MKETIIYGGSFNPPTHAHAAIMELLLDEPAIDEVWAMPSGNRRDKTHDASDKQRLEMLEILKETELQNNERLIISDFEMRLPRPSETYRTLGALSLSYPDMNFWFAFGIDSYKDMPNWKNGAWLQWELPMYVLPRDGVIPPEAPNVRPLPAVVQEASSTLARAATAGNRPLEQFVPAAIARYIAQHRLYRTLAVQ